MLTENKSGFGWLCFFPSPLGRLDDETFFDGAGGNEDVTHFATGQQGLDALQIRHETALGDGRDVRANTALLLRFTTAPDDAAFHRAFTG